LAAVVGLLAFKSRSKSADETTSRTAAVARGPRVSISTVALSPATRRLVLLGEARPFASVTLYAKVSGYLRDVRVDRGDRVVAGQVIATIESPETDRAYAGAKIDYDNKAQLARRIAQLRAKNFVSAQEAEQAEADAAGARERLGALEEQRAYQELKAPFDGTVTARYADPGALLQSAASSQTSALPVVTVSETRRLRVFIYLDQADAGAVRAGTRAEISLDERPAFHVSTTVARVSGELDGKTRKMLAEIDLADRSGSIIAGGFVRVLLEVPQQALPQAPAEALVVRKAGTLVGVVGDDGIVRLRPVRVESNDGKFVTFASGVHVGDRLALNLGAGTADSARVQGTR
jgi:RND family efflux transporter MFP subunit